MRFHVKLPEGNFDEMCTDLLVQMPTSVSVPNSWDGINGARPMIRPHNRSLVLEGNVSEQVTEDMRNLIFAICPEAQIIDESIPRYGADQ